MAADTRLCSLPHLDLNRGARFQIILMNAEPAGCNLDDGILSVLIKILVKASLSGVVENAELLCRPCKAFVRIVADRTVGHSGKHDRHLQFNLRGQIVFQLAVRSPFYFLRFLSQKYLGFHRLPQRVNGRIGDLGSVD